MDAAAGVAPVSVSDDLVSGAAIRSAEGSRGCMPSTARRLVTWSIAATVLKSYKGDLSVGDRIEYRRTIEQGTQMEVGSRHIASFMREDGKLMLPDAGYHFPHFASLDSALTRPGNEM